MLYMDDCYAHHHHAQQKDSLYDLINEQGLEVKAKQKGWQFCFTAEIINTYHSISEENRAVLEQAVLLQETLDIFEGGKKQTKVYQCMFDNAYFIAWIKKLLHSLNNCGVQNTITVMDKGIYPMSLPGDTPRRKLQKADILQGVSDYCLYVDPGMTKL